MDKEEEEDDEVVEEIDVFLSKGLNGMINLIQYPVCSAKRQYAADQRKTARVKPVHKKLELEVVLDVSSPNYDQSKGEQIALNVDGIGGEGMTYESSVMDTQVLTSVAVPHHGKRYVAALVTEGQLHCTPVSEVLQLRPGFKYMDRAEMRALQAAKMKAAESGNSSQDEAEDAKTVSVRFKGAETEAARTARERSYAAYEKRLFAEKWVTASVHSESNSYSERERNRMICKVNPDSCSTFTEMTLPPSQYLANIVPTYSISEAEASINPENILSLSNLKSMSLADQLKALMKNSKIIHFSHLTTLLPDAPEANAVVRSLQSFAVLVQGCWVVKSDVLYPPDTVSSISGIPSETMCKARDYILSKFNLSEFLNRKEIVQVLKMSGEEIKVMFDQIAVMKAGKGWRLRLLPDLRFSSKFPEVCERQAMVWKARHKQLAKHFNVSEDTGKTTTPDPHKKNKLASPKEPKATVKRSPKEKNKASLKPIKKEPLDDKKSTVKNGGNKPSVNKLEIKSESLTNGDSVQIKTELLSPSANSFTPMDYEFSDTEKATSFKKLLEDTSASSDSVNGFLNSSVELFNKNETIPEPMDTNIQPFINPSNVQIGVTMDQHGPINVDGINSTVALVADQVRLQMSSPKSCQDNQNIFNGNKPVSNQDMQH
ncbi:DNA-directed RNA polymerase III subunit RPC5 [Ciona intestinalis]